ncbi:hypothetical protein [Streptomyces mirabilis]|uniref:hypothetical protein n=1 Tax=Streptomyces mirabilis TaxID=68239 RepID=UPI003323769E
MERQHIPDLRDHQPAGHPGDHLSVLDGRDRLPTPDGRDRTAVVEPRPYPTVLGLRMYIPTAPPHESPARLVIPAELSAGLGYDAVGTSPEHGERIMDCLPRVGCVFADDERWWWIVPSGSHIGVTWPPSISYAVGARLADPSWTRALLRSRPARPRLIHRPEGDSPYTPPIPLYFLTCRLAGSTPSWSLGTGI